MTVRRRSASVKGLSNVCILRTVSGEPGPLRIGAFARRVGVSPDVLRSWERRYGLLQPRRSEGGFRLYDDEDAARVARMRAAVDHGLSAAEAARVVLSGPGRPDHGALGDAAARLFTAIVAYDEASMHAILDESFEAFSIDIVLRDLVFPTLRRVGAEWQQGRLEVSQEHFASHVIRGRLLSLARLWGRGAGPLALLACVPGEGHDISLLAFGLVLRSHGWRVLFLGADTPVSTVIDAVRLTHPAATVVTSFDPGRLEAQSAELERLSRETPLALSGPGVPDDLCSHLGARHLGGDLLAAAGEVAATG
jgi:MerR family transcriptional regulator, light-induced transcriptional regulator